MLIGFIEENPMKVSLSFFGLAAAILLILAAAPAVVSAQDEVLVTKGISGDEDSGDRNPTLSVRTEHVADPRHVKILADAYVGNKEFTRYPIKFEFYVNRHLFVTQIRSIELPGAVGVDVGTGVATPPFNYTVVATVLHPNRQYTTVLNGAVFASDLTASLSCTVNLFTVGDDLSDGTTETFTQEEVAVDQTGENQVDLSFEAKDAEETSNITVASALTLSADKSTLTGSVDVTQDGETTTYTVSGESTFEDDSLQSFTASSEDDLLQLSCV
ncbi:MAG: hypothetical protein DCC75_01930 [Proteobacteria bacterium]|nr:MAG: hypothetical protein DCC75_01930 [Pseudomonadota bacterium]